MNLEPEALARIFEFRDAFLKKYYGRTFYPYQTEPSDKIIQAALTGQGQEFYVEISRQGGKTEMICCTIVFLLIFAQELFAELGHNLGTPGWYIVIGAPQQEQAKTDFDRIKEYLRPPCKEMGIAFQEANGTTLRLSNGSIGYCFPVSPTAHIESKTAHFILVEEAQDVPDQEKDKKLVPMGTATDAPIVNVGTAGYKMCNFHKGLHGADQTRVFKYDCFEVMRQKRAAYEKDGNEWHLNYERYVKRQIREKGDQNPEVRSQYFLEWQLERGMWLTETAFNDLLDPALTVVREDREHECIVGLDVAKESDVTFVTVWRQEGVKTVTRRSPATRTLELTPEQEEEKARIESANYDPLLGRPAPPTPKVETYFTEEHVEAPVYRLLNWFMINGVLHQHQWEAIDAFLDNYNVWKMNIDSTGIGDATADYYLVKFNGWNYDYLQRMERAGLRGTVRPVKFTPQSKHRMYSNFEIAIKEGRVIIPGAIDGMSDAEKACFDRFRLENLNALREWRGSLLNVRHPDRGKGESGDIETDDSLDSAALAFYDPESEPTGFEMETM